MADFVYYKKRDARIVYRNIIEFEYKGLGFVVLRGVRDGSNTRTVAVILLEYGERIERLEDGGEEI